MSRRRSCGTLAWFFPMLLLLPACGSRPSPAATSTSVGESDCERLDRASRRIFEPVVDRLAARGD